MARAAHHDRSGFDALVTEGWSPESADLDLRPTSELVSLMAAEETRVPVVVAAAGDAIARAVDSIAERLAAGGRLVYVGAGTSGRLAHVDAAECESTFSVDPGVVVALMAGGVSAKPFEQEAAEDDRQAGWDAVTSAGMSSADAVVGISASGRTPFTLGAIEAARAAAALTVAVVSVPRSPLGDLVDHEIAVVVGPEVIAGSTRLKAGTAQKLVLNMISTIAMIRLGKTYGNLMVDVAATNDKLRARVQRIVEIATGESPERVRAMLDETDGDAKVAIIALSAHVDVPEARARLAASGGIVRKALTP